MVVGFNHNFRYAGEIYHIQTEDSGLRSPNIVTLLYQGGTILASKKTSYADIAKVDNLDQVVEELMKEQHKNMLRDLKAGEFDAVIRRFKEGKLSRPQVIEAEPIAQHKVHVPPPEVVSPSPGPGPVAVPEPVAPLVEQAVRPAVPPTEKPLPSPVVEIGLDEVILSYLLGDKK